ncbi:hypothetical protein ACFCYN_22645 [Gottfriedia sp. NPDC056225]|uniref:hypothetical protein n=1 Tax=Gottfriedia sp. NPDC056225 TaxID=3345751 RepID=UPI0035DB7C2C
MQNRNVKKIILFLCIIIGLAIVLLPVLAPVIHDNNTAKSAIRQYIYKKGYTYQSFFAIIEDDEHDDPEYGHLYGVTWFDRNNPVRDTSPLFYVKKFKEGYKVTSVGTGP